MVDAEGFQYKYVPKEAIVISPEGKSKQKGNRSRKVSNVSESSSGKKFIYVKKQVEEKTSM